MVIKPIAFLTLPSPSSLLKLPFCFHSKRKTCLFRGTFLEKDKRPVTLGAGALSLKNGGAWRTEGSIALKVTMATVRAPTTRHRHTKKFSGILTEPHTYLKRGWAREGAEIQQPLKPLFKNDQPSKASTCKCP